MEGYEDIDNIVKRQNDMLDNSLQQQRDIINKQTDLNVAELERNKQEVDKDANKTKKADFDFQISKARQTGDISLAQSSLQIYNQKMQLLAQEYEMRNNRKQFLYQQDRDRVADNQWQQQYDYQRQRDAVSDNQWQTQFDYQKQRDAVADSQWQKQYELSKKASASRSSSRSTSNNKVADTSNSKVTAKQVINNIQIKQGTFMDKNGKIIANPGVIDGLSGKTFANVEDVLKYYNL